MYLCSVVKTIKVLFLKRKRKRKRKKLLILILFLNSIRRLIRWHHHKHLIHYTRLGSSTFSLLLNNYQKVLTTSTTITTNTNSWTTAIKKKKKKSIIPPSSSTLINSYGNLAFFFYIKLIFNFQHFSGLGYPPPLSISLRLFII